MGLRDTLTAASMDLIDFRRPGALFFSNHKYSQRELLERIFVITSAATLGFLNWMQSQEGWAIPIASGAALGFLISHTITMSPLIYKRLVFMWNCYNIQKEIKSNIAKDKMPFIELVNSVVEQILEHKGSKSASATWGKRERLMTNLLTWLKDNTHDSLVMNEALGNADIISSLDTSPEGPPQQLRLK